MFLNFITFNYLFFLCMHDNYKNNEKKLILKYTINKVKYKMFYTNEEYKSVFQKFFNKNGMMVKLLWKNTETKSEVIGYVTRMEYESSDDTAQVLIDISLIKNYIKNKYDDKKFSIRDYKYFSLKHLFNELKKEDNFPAPVNINDINSIISYIEMHDLKNIQIKRYILNNILNIKNYYKNKRIELFLI